MVLIGLLFIFTLGFAIAAFVLAKFVLFLATVVLFVIMLGTISITTSANQEQQRLYWESQRSERTWQYMHRPCWMQDFHTEINSRNNITVTAFNNCTFNNCNFYLNSNTDRNAPALPEGAAQNVLPVNSGYSELPVTAPQYPVEVPYAEFDKIH